MAFGIFSPKEEYKLVVLVRTDLDMGKGKIAAQGGHALRPGAAASTPS